MNEEDKFLVLKKHTLQLEKEAELKSHCIRSAKSPQAVGA